MFVLQTWIDTKGLPDDRQSFECPVPESESPKTGFITSIATGGHIDEIVRFAGSRDTVVIADVLEEERNTVLGKMVLEAVSSIETALDDYTRKTGIPIKRIRVPMPPLMTQVCEKGTYIYESMESLVFNRKDLQEHINEGNPINVIASASYINYLVTNGVVLVAKYMKPGRSELFAKADSMAVSALKEAFPDRDVVQVDVEALNYIGGGMNCISQQEPRI